MSEQVRVALLTEGSYPVLLGGVSTWCDQLIAGLPDVEFSVHSITGSGREPVRWPKHPNCTQMQLMPMWGQRRPPYLRFSRRNREQLLLDGLLSDLWLELLRETPDQVECERIMDKLFALSERVEVTRLLSRSGSIAAILNAWSALRGSEEPISVADATAAASMVDRHLALIDRRLPKVSVIHTASNGAAALVGMVNAQRQNKPLILSEHGVYLRERYLALRTEGYSWHTRTAVMAFVRMICTMCYRRCAELLPVNQYNSRWERRLGADPAKITTILNGVEVDAYRALESEPDTPTISFVGRIDPLKDLATLLRAFALVLDRVPDARLRLFGPVPKGNEPYFEGLVQLADELGIEPSLSWEGPSDGSVPAFEAGSVVALSSISEGLPYTVIEAMMCGRPTVNTDVGGVSEAVGGDQECGRLVPPRDHRAFADACIDLLLDRDRRRTMGRAAQRRARVLFDLPAFITKFRKIYLSYAEQSGAGTVGAFNEQCNSEFLEPAAATPVGRGSVELSMPGGGGPTRSGSTSRGQRIQRHGSASPIR